MFNNFKVHFPSLPMVNVLRFFPGYPGLIPDSFEGMKSLMNHLINLHGSHRIAYIRGPENNFSADERYRGYTEALKENNIQYDPLLVTPNLSWDDGDKGIDILIDKNGLKPCITFDAIAASNDTLAINAMKQLNSKGIKVPADIKVVGFDDNTNATFSVPPLTTAGYNLGRSAVEILIKILNGENVSEKTFVSSEIVIRRSCACIYSSILHVSTHKSENPPKQNTSSEITQEKRKEIVENMVVSLENNISNKNSAIVWMEQIFDTFMNVLKLSENNTGGSFLNTLENVLYQVKSEKSKLHVWQNMLSVLRNSIFPFLNKNNFLNAENIWQQARLLIEEMTRQDQAKKKYKQEEMERTLHQIETDLLSTFSVKGLMDLLEEKLPSLGIKSCYLVLYNDSGFSKLVLGYDHNKTANFSREIKENSGIRFESIEFLPEGILPERQHSFIVESLSFKDYNLGYVLFETESSEASVFERLRSTISSALQGTLLLDKVRENTEQLNMIAIQTLTTSEEIQATLSETTNQLQVVSDSAQKSMNVSVTGQDAVSKTVVWMEEIQRLVEDIASSIINLSKQINQIEEIINTVEDIVKRSEVLAINASIQATRAGSHGLGFGVVAHEMRNLADQSGKATKNITNILNNIRKATKEAVAVTEEGSKGAEHGMKLAGDAGEAIKELASSIEISAKMAIQISTSTEQQTSAMNELVRSVQTIKEANTETSAQFKEIGL